MLSRGLSCGGLQPSAPASPVASQGFLPRVSALGQRTAQSWRTDGGAASCLLRLHPPPGSAGGEPELHRHAQVGSPGLQKLSALTSCWRAGGGGGDSGGGGSGGSGGGGALWLVAEAVAGGGGGLRLPRRLEVWSAAVLVDHPHAHLPQQCPLRSSAAPSSLPFALSHLLGTSQNSQLPGLLVGGAAPAGGRGAHGSRPLY